MFNRLYKHITGFGWDRYFKNINCYYVPLYMEPEDLKEVSKILDKNSVHFEELGIIIEKEMIINEKTKVTIDEMKSYNTSWLIDYMSA